MDNATEEIKKGERFSFGENWQAFLSVLNDDRIKTAETALRRMLGVDSLTGKTFLDIGSGSGICSLAAKRMGATVYSFDYDPQSVACTQELKRRYFSDDAHWTISEGSALDKEWLATLGKWDIVYSWGVLHHTGDMWTALNYAGKLVKDGGTLFIAIYNDQGKTSKRWKQVKKRYVQGGWLTRKFLFAIYFVHFFWAMFLADLIKHGNMFYRWNKYYEDRGMSRIYDLKDWLGGYPFEVAKPEEIIDFYLQRGFRLTKLTTCGGALGCNQFVFVKQSV